MTRDTEQTESDATGRARANSDDQESTAALAVATAEARKTLDEQLAALTDVDAKAIQLLQFTVAVLGVTVTGLSTLEATPDQWVTRYLALGLGLYVLGAVLAVVTYAVTPRIVGVDPSDATRRAAAGSEREFRRALLGGYTAWIRFNGYVTRRSALVLTAVLLLVLGGSLSLALGFYRLFVGPLPPFAPASALAVTGIAACASRIHRQIRRFREAEPPTRPDVGDGGDQRIDGQEIFASEDVDGVAAASQDGTE